MTVAADRGRIVRALRAVASFMMETLGEAVFEMILTLLSCGILVGLAFAFAWGLERSPRATMGVAGALLVFLGYGGWQMFRPATSRRRGRLAGVAVATFAVAVVIVVYGSSCGCFT